MINFSLYIFLFLYIYTFISHLDLYLSIYLSSYLSIYLYTLYVNFLEKRLERKDAEWPITLPPQTVRNAFAIDSSQVRNTYC